MNKNIQSESQLENNLIKQLQSLGYSFVSIPNENELLNNLKRQLEKHNKTVFSDSEFKKILNHLNKGGIFERAGILRDKMSLSRDDGSVFFVVFMDTDHWCKNEFHVSNQITIKGVYENRYDVTILVNGLPLVQIELKRRGVELKKAFNQIDRYKKHSFGAGNGLFQYLQMFVISNGVNTKYFSNNRKQGDFKQTFCWTDRDNKPVNKLEDFANIFLEPCHLSKMIAKYIVLHQSDKILMILRPYQFYAVEDIVDRVKNSDSNGYIWHTTGSGKTLTSFKASQMLRSIPDVKKVVFCVDRKDLDYQTTQEFNHFSEGSIDGTNNTRQLVEQFKNDTKLIVTTIQKLNTAISKDVYLKEMNKIADEKIVFIFDECHRSQFGETHKKIKTFFSRNQMFGFTGTPIFAENSNNKKTTADLFDKCLHKYVITDAINDENVLRFSVEYVGKYKRNLNSKTNIDIPVEGINDKELLNSDKRLDKITDYIINNHDIKTHDREFTGMFCVSSVESLIKYYEIFKKKKLNGDHDLKIATIFSYGVNEDSSDSMDDDIQIEVPQGQENKHSREKIDEFISDYNKMFGSDFSTKDSKSFYGYYQDIAKKVKDKKIDILLVVNMFLTGFDSKPLNTLYVDKNLKYHGLVQAFSRTNRILNTKKSQGNIVCFRNLKEATDEAIALFSNKEAKEIILMKSFEEYLEDFSLALYELRTITPTTEDVDSLISEEEQLDFIKKFRDVARVKNILETFSDFNHENIGIKEQEFEDFKSKYLDIYDKVKSDIGKDSVSILDDVDFETELLKKDIINVSYILSLLGNLNKYNPDEAEEKKKSILSMVSSDPELRNKRDLIEEFIEENLMNLDEDADLDNEFNKFLNNKGDNELSEFCEKEGLDKDKFDKIIKNYNYTGKKPLGDEIRDAKIGTFKLIDRKNAVDRIIGKMVEIVDRFMN